jgi:hypothetical protein
MPWENMYNVVTYFIPKQDCNILQNSKMLLHYVFMPQGGIVQESPKWFGMHLETVHKMKIETWIEEPLTPLDSWHMISAISPLTLGSHALEGDLFIDFKN